MNSKQLTLKISANSVYGYTGQTVAKLSLVEIAKTVTSIGRDSIEKAKRTVEKMFVSRSDDVLPATVIYGDTDSIMINFNHSCDTEGVRMTFEDAHTVARMINNQMKKPMKMEVEKGLHLFPFPLSHLFLTVYRPYLLLGKKMYMGNVSTNLKNHLIFLGRNIQVRIFHRLWTRRD